MPLTDEAWAADLPEEFKTVVSTDQGLYGAPNGTTQAGGVIYNKKVYAELGLQVPTTWAEFKANNDKIKAAGKVAPIQQTYGETWTSQLFVLGDFANVAAQDPQWADQYTANKRKYARPAGTAELQEPAGRLRLRLLQQELRLGQVRRRHQGGRHRDGRSLPDAVQRGLGHQPELQGQPRRRRASSPCRPRTPTTLASPSGSRTRSTSRRPPKAPSWKRPRSSSRSSTHRRAARSRTR